MDYTRYTVKDFVLDEYFQEWILEPSAETDDFWESWLEEHPERTEALANAREIILNLQIREREPDEFRMEQIWQTITEANDAFDSYREKAFFRQETGRMIKLSPWQKWARIAASVILLVSAGVAVMIYPSLDNKTEHITAYGETRTIVLPDSSTVMLNANSRISYSNAWDKAEKREIWLDGEAYFSVVHTRTHQKFIVHASDNISVEVLGTTFDVLRRSDRTRVVLNSGKIKLNLWQDDRHEQIVMEPGDLLEFKEEPLDYVRKQTNPKNIVSWTEHKLTFDGTPLKDVVTILQENYGLQVLVLDSALLKQKLWGSVPSNDAILLLEAMSNSFNLNIHKVANQVQISNNDLKPTN